jgi:selenocysteine-specific elongation factor
MSYTIVGVIGHIDHGKTSLVAALTGIDTDTHPEEKRRGITIDLGFASYTAGEHRFALVDAPGHQKYIGNLLAGVSGVDIGLLVVACDQGIQAQTLEHAAILQSLGVSKLIVAISRIDLADDETRDELCEELDVFLADYGFHNIPKVAVSTVTGQGLDELRSLLQSHARNEPRRTDGSFRMPIDRVFTIEGRGAVVAGTPWTGEVAVGDHLQLADSGKIVRVRELEVHGQAVERSHAGLRTAMNLAGVATSQLKRGDELVTEGTHQPARRMMVQLQMFQDTPDLRCPATVQIHLATASCAARIIGVKRLRAGQRANVIIETDHPVVATYHQACLFRRPYPVGSFAGGRILGALGPGDRKTSTLLQLAEGLESSSALDRLVAWVDFRGELRADPVWAESQLGVGPDDLSELSQQAVDEKRVEAIDGRLVSLLTIDRLNHAITSVLAGHAESEEDVWLDEESLIRRIGWVDAGVVRRQLERLIGEEKVVRVNRMVALASKQTILSKKQRIRMDQILEVFHGNRTPPTVKELVQRFEMSQDAVQSLLRFATQQRILIDLGGGFFIERAVWEALMSELAERFDQTSELSVAEIRDQWKITRKHAIPILEQCDRHRWTVREGDKRRSGPSLREFQVAVQGSHQEEKTIE